MADGGNTAIHLIETSASVKLTPCESFGDVWFWMVFRGGGGNPLSCIAGEDQKIYAFAFLCSMAFVAFVAIDLCVYLVRKFGYDTDDAGQLGIAEHGFKTLGVALFGALAAWVVGFFAAIIEILNLSTQTAVATGVLWQVVYAQMLARFRADDGAEISIPISDSGEALDEDDEDLEQELSEEVAE